MAAKSIPGFEELADVWNHRAPIGWDLADPEPAGRGVVALLLGLVPEDHRRDRPRRRRRAHDGRLSPRRTDPPSVRPASARVRRRPVPRSVRGAGRRPFGPPERAVAAAADGARWRGNPPCGAAAAHARPQYGRGGPACASDLALSPPYWPRSTVASLRAAPLAVRRRAAPPRAAAARAPSRGAVRGRLPHRRSTAPGSPPTATTPTPPPTASGCTSSATAGGTSTWTARRSRSARRGHVRAHRPLLEGDPLGLGQPPAGP